MINAPININIINFNDIDEIRDNLQARILAVGRANEIVQHVWDNQNETWLNAMRGSQFNETHFSIRIVGDALNLFNNSYQNVNPENINSFIVIAHNFLLESHRTGKPFIAIETEEHFNRFRLVTLSI